MGAAIDPRVGVLLGEAHAYFQSIGALPFAAKAEAILAEAEVARA